jgi:hypothetical protein
MGSPLAGNLVFVSQETMPLRVDSLVIIVGGDTNFIAESGPMGYPRTKGMGQIDEFLRLQLGDDAPMAGRLLSEHVNGDYERPHQHNARKPLFSCALPPFEIGQRPTRPRPVSDTRGRTVSVA